MYDFENPKHTQTHRSAKHTTDHGDRGAQGSSGSCSVNGQGSATSSRITAVLCVCARGGKFGPNLETTSGEEISCPDLSLRSRQSTRFRRIFLSWKLSEPTFVSTCSVHNFFIWANLNRHQDLWPTSGYHKQWSKTAPIFPPLIQGIISQLLITQRDTKKKTEKRNWNSIHPLGLFERPAVAMTNHDPNTSTPHRRF